MKKSKKTLDFDIGKEYSGSEENIDNNSLNENFNKSMSTACIISIILSIIWFSFLGYFFFASSVNINFLKLNTLELGMVFTASFAPLIFIWLITFYFDSIRNSNDEKNNIYSFLMSAFSDDEKSKTFLNSIEKNLKAQVNVLKTELKEFEDKASEIKNIYDNMVLSNRKFVDSMQTETETLEKMDTFFTQKATENIKVMSQEIGKIRDDFDHILTGTNENLESLKWQTEGLSSVVDNISVKSDDIAKSVGSLEHEVKESIEVINNGALELSKVFEGNIGIFKQYQDDFVDYCADYKQKSADLVTDIDEKSKNVEKHLSDFNSNFSSQTEKLYETSDKFLSITDSLSDKIGQVKDVVEIEKDIIVKSEEVIVEKGNRIQELVADFKGGLSENLADLKVQVESVDAVFDKQNRNISDVFEIIQSKSEAVVGNLNSASNSLLQTSNASGDKIAGVVEKIKSNTSYLENVFVKQNKAVEYVAGMLESQDLSLENVLKRQKQIVGESDGLIKKYSDDFSKNVNLITGQSDKVIQGISAVSDSIESKGDLFRDLIAKISFEVKAVNENIKEGVENFTTTTKLIRATSDNVKAAMEFNTEELKANAKVASEYTKNIKGTIEQQANDLANIANIISSQTRLAEYSLDEQVVKLDECYNKFTGGLAKLNKDVAGMFKNIESLTGQMDKNFDKKSEKINKKTAIINKNIAQNILDIDKAIEQFNNLSGDVDKSLKDISLNVENSKKQINKKVELENKKDSVKATKVLTSDFMEKTALIMEKLGSVSVDLARVYDENISEKIWNDYYAGKRNVFTKHLAKNLNKKDAEKVKSLIKKDESFKEYVDTFIKEYEVLVSQTEKAGVSDVMFPVFATSEFGKLYMFFKGL